ncbi:nucleolar complex protein 3 homolog isoform X3 [Pistacia vera]|uniref:nucleolar complex protein 3 homolog isoform X3 n=1 Tax=Pistacia vera TaxID=55513 RepID=UPI001263B3CA|nr:nucleolar complex protein 3 homolog isoform X3 [Pistacia vera]
MGKKKQKVVLPPDLPPEISEDEIEISDEDLEFVKENRDYAGFVSRLDTQSITKCVDESGALEAIYEKRLQKKSVVKENEESGVKLDPVDALPVKTLDGKLYYRALPKKVNGEDENKAGEDEKDDGADKGIVKLTKPERRAKLKKIKKEAKKQGKELTETKEAEQAPQAAVLAEVKKDLTAEEAFESKKHKLAELGIALLADPESNIKSLKEMLQIARDDNPSIAKLGFLSLLAVFKDIIPGYRIRLPTEKELEMKVSKDVKKMRFHESTLLSTYKGYLQKLIASEKQFAFHQVVVRCICNLLDSVPHFNCRESLLEVVVRNLASHDDVVRKLCYTTIKSLFTNEGKHGGEATVEAVRLIAYHVKANNCQLHPDFVEVLMSLSFDEDLRRAEVQDRDNKAKHKKNKIKNVKEPSKLQENDRKKSKKELMAKTREEVSADYKSVSLAPDVMEKIKMQSETISAVFETYFRILKHTMISTAASSESNANSTASASEAHPLLAPCLNGLGKFSHLVDLDYIGDLMNYLKKLAGGGSSQDNSSQKCSENLTVSERLRCCIVAFKVMRNNLDALNVDLQDFFVQLYNLVLEYRPGRDQGEVLVEALKIMLCDDRQHDMQKAAAFVKRLATFSLSIGSAESMAALVTLKNLLQKNVKCRNLLENDAGGGSVSGSIAIYQPYATDPNLSGALASVLWELNLLSKHYHPAISTMASGISNMNTAQNQIYHTLSPQQAFMEFSLERESFNPKGDIRKSNNKRKRANESSILAGIDSTSDTSNSINEDEVSKKLSKHFTVLHNIKENERLRGELDRVTLSLNLYEEYKKQKKAGRTKIKKNKI